MYLHEIDSFVNRKSARVQSLRARDHLVQFYSARGYCTYTH